MPRKRIESKRRRDDVLAHSDGFLLFWCGWSFNTRPTRPEPIFENIEDMKRYYFENRERVLREVGMESWAYHTFEDHDRANCEFCQIHDIEADMRRYT